MLSDQYDEILRKVDGHRKTLADLEERTQLLEERFKKKEQDNLEMRAITGDLEQYSRRSNVGIYGVQKQENEDLFEVVKDLAHKLQLT